MTAPPPADLAASVRQRLLALSRARGESFDLTLTHYAIERFLYRLSESEHARRFVVKGAMLFALWTGEPHRPTRDLDLLMLGDSSAEALAGIVREVVATEVVPDGIAFDPDSLRVEPIRAGGEYQGHRIRLTASLSGARIRLQIDVGVGDHVIPPPASASYPALLAFPAPRLRMYPRETMVAEKVQAMVELGVANSRMKDFYDVWVLSRRFPFEGPMLAAAIRGTFARRRTAVPSALPVALTPQFSRQPGKAQQWTAFLRRSNVAEGPAELTEVIEALKQFLTPALSAVAEGRDLECTWPPGGPWRKQE